MPDMTARSALTDSPTASIARREALELIHAADLDHEVSYREIAEWDRRAGLGGSPDDGGGGQP